MRTLDQRTLDFILDTVKRLERTLTVYRVEDDSNTRLYVLYACLLYTSDAADE